MIQKTNARHSSTAVAPVLRPAQDSPEHWGQWSGRKHYSLEVVQNPLRARMCGFGDKDRRPLAPAAVAKMIVRRDDNTLIDVDDVDCSFFLVTVDLWSADGKQEMNLVLHPSSADRYVPTHTAKTRRRGTSSTSTNQRTGPQSPVASGSPPNSTQYPIRSNTDTSSNAMPPMMSPYSNQSYPFPQQSTPIPEPMPFQAAPPYGPSESAPAWGYTHPAPMDRSNNYPQPPLPSIQSFGRTTSSANTMGSGVNMSSGEQWHPEGHIRDETDVASFRAWPTDTQYPAVDPTSSGVFTSPTIDSSLRAPPPVHSSSHPDSRGDQWSQSGPPPASADANAHHGRYSQDSFSPAGSSPQFDNSIYASASYAQQSQQAPYYPGSYVQNPSPPSPSTIPPLPRQSYTRTLVGPLSANACRLQDEHRKPGVFFLFQDLSVRTEGTFRLRMRLMNVGAPPAPEAGALRVHTDVSPVLAQTFTEPFIVYSAKRFPGVPDTTALSIAFGNQGQKLPLRNRHGSSKQGRRRQRGGDSDGSDDGSDGA